MGRRLDILRDLTFGEVLGIVVGGLLVGMLVLMGLVVFDARGVL